MLHVTHVRPQHEVREDKAIDMDTRDGVMRVVSQMRDLTQKSDHGKRGIVRELQNAAATRNMRFD